MGEETARTQSRVSGTVLVLVIVLGKLKTDYEYAYEYEQKTTFCKNAAAESLVFCEAIRIRPKNTGRWRRKGPEWYIPRLPGLRKSRFYGPYPR